MQEPDSLPRDWVPDATLAFLCEGYRYISGRCERLRTDVFRTRIMLRPVICLRGERGIGLLYGEPGLTRRGAMPSLVLNLLQGKDSVQQVEGAEHRIRKALYVDLLIEEPAAERLANRFSVAWTNTLLRDGATKVLTSASDTLARVVCDWAGLAGEFGANPAFRRALYLMSARAGRFGPSAWSALAYRHYAEAQLIPAIRNSRQEWGRTPLARIAAQYGSDGAHLPERVAVIELLNVLRPVVAVGRYIAFAAQRLIEMPEWREILATNDSMIMPFCEEVRRTSPFFPLTAAVTTKPIEAEGLRLPAGQWLMADLWGTLQDERLFPNPETFKPERSLDWRNPATGFVPQGGGDIAATHRCPGEKVTVALMAAAVRLMCRDIEWKAPEQDFSISLSRMPAQPKSGVIIKNIRPR